MLKKVCISGLILLILTTLTGCHLRSEIIGSIQETADGGYILAGQEKLDLSPHPQALLIKTDNRGEKEWTRIFPDLIGFAGVQQTDDGGFIVQGTTTNSFFEYPIRSLLWTYLIKFDSQGNQEWVYSSGDKGFTVDQVSSGGYLLRGRDSLTKLDSHGNEEWVYNPDLIRFAHKAPEGEYVLGGSAWVSKVDPWGNEIWTFLTDDKWENAMVNQDGCIFLRSSSYLAKLDALGNEEWRQRFSSYSGRFSFGWQTEDGGRIILGNKLIKLGAEGNQEYEYSLPFSLGSVHLVDVGGCILLSGHNPPDVAKLNAMGNSEWTLSLDGYGVLLSAWQTPDEGYLISGTKLPPPQNRTGPAPRSAWLLKLDSTGKLEWEQEYKEIEEIMLIKGQDGGYYSSAQQHMSVSRDIRLHKFDALGNLEWSQTFGTVSVSRSVIYSSWLLTFFIFNIIVLSFYIKDIVIRQGNKLRWFLTFLFLGPFAVAWYKTCCDVNEGMTRGDDKFHVFVCYYWPPMRLYLRVLPVVFYGLNIFFDPTILRRHDSFLIISLFFVIHIIINEILSQRLERYRGQGEIKGREK